MYELWYDHVKLRYEEKPQLCYMNTDIFLVYIKNRHYLHRHLKSS